jgi:glycosyltransferase involved in cell wall biosynthesis
MIPGAEGLIVPCKLFGIMAASRPAIFIGNERSELALVLTEHDAGVVIEPGDTAHLAATLRELADDPARVREMGENAREALSDAYSRERACEQWRTLLEDVANTTPLTSTPTPATGVEP